MEKNLLKGRPKILIDVIVLAVICIITLFLPYAQYTYKNQAYALKGISFLTGKKVAGGTVLLTTNLWIALGMAAAIAAMAVAVFYSKLRPRLSAGIMAICAFTMIGMQVVFSMTLSGILEGTKKVGLMYGSLIFMGAAFLILVRSLYLLSKAKVLSAMDFMVLPGLLYLIINNYVPMFGIAIAFKKIDYSKGIFGSDWVGFDNFKNLFYSAGNLFDSDAFIITRNTLLYNIVFIILGIVTGVAAGIMLAEVLNRFWKKFFQTTILLPQLISMVVVSYIVYAFLSSENGLITKTFFADQNINFYGIKWLWPFLLVFINNWKLVGYNAIIFLSSVVGINKSLYEAAKVDGATKWQQISKITLPLLKPTIITVLLLQIGRIFYSDFGLFYQVPLDSGTLYSVTNTVDTYVYRSLMVSNNISVSSAASAYQAVVGFVLVAAANLVVKKLDKESALF